MPAAAATETADGRRPRVLVKEKIGDSGVALLREHFEVDVGVDWSDALTGAQSFIRHYSWTFPNLRDSEGTVGNAYRLRGLPTTFVVDSRRRIRAALRGPQDEGSFKRALAGVG